MKTAGAFHYAKDSGNFGRKTNEKFIPTEIFRITSGGGPLISVKPVRLKFAVPLLTNWFIVLLLFTHVENSERELKMVRAIPLSWPGLIGKSRSIFLGYSHWSLTGRFGISESTPLDINTKLGRYGRFFFFIIILNLLAGFFRGSQKETRGSQLAAGGSRLEARARRLAK